MASLDSLASSSSSLGEASDGRSISPAFSSPPTSPCSGSILLNPLPPKVQTKGRKKVLSVLVSHYPSRPPAHFLAANPGFGACPDADLDSRGRSLSANRSSGTASPVGSAAAAAKCKGLTFAPLPEGKPRRSNSISIGVAARAQMISGQGGGTPGGQPRYAGECRLLSAVLRCPGRFSLTLGSPRVRSILGPQQWYQPGAELPPEVYTYRDVQKGLGKMWNRVRRRPSSSSSAADALAMEKEGKGKSKEIEHIEETHEGDEDDEEEEEERGRMGEPAIGVGPGAGDDASSTGTTSTVDLPRTPDDERCEHIEGEVVVGGKALGEGGTGGQTPVVA